jgi:hypothetical protein
MKTRPSRRKVIFISTSLLVLTLAAMQTAAQCTDPPKGLLAWWPAEGNAGDVAGNNHGTLQNGATFTPGYVGQQAFSFDGQDDYVLVPDAASLRPTNFTFECWVNFLSLGSMQQLVSKTFGPGWHESYGLYLNDRLLVGTAGGENNAFVMFNLNPTTGVWYHVAYTFDDAADAHTLYVNGAPVVSAVNTFTTTYDTHPVVLGAEYENESMAYYLHGAIDEASIYNHALSPSAIAAIYAAGAGGKCRDRGVPATIRVSQVEICWNSDTNTGYQVQYRSDLTTNVWAPLVECVRGGISNTCVTDPVLPAMPKRFYRVIQTNCVPAP